MESAEQHDAHLIHSVEGATQAEGQRPIPLTEDLKQIGVDARHIIGSTVNELAHGEGRDSRDRLAIKQNPFKLALERAKSLKNRLLKKAA